MTKEPKTSIIRSILFSLTLYLGTLVLMIIYLPTFLLPRKKAGILPKVWSKITPKALKLIANVDLKVEGLENLPKENGYIVASKHQSAMETTLFHALVPHTFYVLKKELLWLPLAGLYFLKTGCVAIDRSGGTKTMRIMTQKVKERLKEGMNLVIFPEGTRTEPNSKKPYTPGVAFLYDQCKVPVVPVAINSGYCWPKNKTLKNEGTVTLRFLPPIEAGLDKREFMKKLYDTIETNQDSLPHPFESTK